MTSVRGPGLYEFLIEAELQQYYAGIKNDLKVQNVPQLKYVTEDDLHTIGMSKPEMRRLKKFFQKHFPQNYLSKFKKILLRKEEQVSTFPTLPDELIDKPPIKVPNKHIIPAEAIIVNKELGTGELLQQGVWTNDGERIQVAIKCLSRERMQNNPIEFLKEAAIMHAIDHEHIVRLYGVVLDTNALMLVTELAPLRSLLECLKEPSLRASFPILSLCDFAIQICDGMQYLEMKRLIHRDLAARNILVFSKNKVKISDFGLSRALGVGKDYYQTNFNVNLKLPIAWCAPECISYLRFTSASDVWAYGVTLWEMFSYGFQPWAALTGHQILEAIDEPNFQCKPEQVQAVQEYGDDPKVKQREQLMYRVGDVITVLDKGPFPNVSNFWKGILNNGKTGLFNPAYTVAYLGSNLPSNKTEFIRGDGKNAYSSRRRLRPDMISSPQGDFKHTSHVGLDGAYFGDISFLGGKYHHLPRQVVTPYKPQEDSEQLALGRSVSDASSDRAPLLTGTEPTKLTLPSDAAWSDTASESSVSQTATGGGKGGGPKFLLDHEYHEISDEEGAVESPRFEKSFDFGPSLLDEMDAVFRSFGGSEAPPPPPSPGLPPPPASPLDETINVRNELREMAAKVTGKKKQATCERPKIMFTKLEQRSWIKIEVARGRSAQECFQELHEACGDAALPYRTVARWVKAFWEGLVGSAVKVMFIVAYDIDGIILHHPVPPRQTVNADYYCRFLQHHLRPALRRKRRHLGVQNPIILHDNAKSHTAAAVKDLLCRWQWEILEHPLNSPDNESMRLRSLCQRRSIRNINKDGRADGVRRLPNIWQKVKPISAADQRTLDCAIAMANELTARSMNDLDNGTPPESPHTPGTPGKRKFSFRFPSTGTNKHTSPRQDRKTFSEEAASIPDIQVGQS
ncbi:hypothetical protein ANN_16185 [Periplaneta americana]|uniref:non-specific protein-tyrosine kinase n=1 Tax=Periplaneta americana TaxID=6978 RepID=A0ABQ8SIE3_PERAM|nr:hypothetical protein ANN_16185 [Periplaneta americana]